MSSLDGVLQVIVLLKCQHLNTPEMFFTWDCSFFFTLCIFPSSLTRLAVHSLETYIGYPQINAVKWRSYEKFTLSLQMKESFRCLFATFFILKEGSNVPFNAEMLLFAHFCKQSNSSSCS